MEKNFEQSEAARLAVSLLRAGQSDSLRWWDDHSLTDAGRRALLRLFPRDPVGIAVRLAFKAAQARHRGILQFAGVRDATTLMDLAGEALLDRSVNWRVPERPVSNMGELKLMLAEAIPGLPLPAVDTPGEGPVLDLSDARVRRTASLPMILAAGYLMGGPELLIVPFVRKEVPDRK